MASRLTLYVDQGTDFTVTISLDESAGTPLDTEGATFFSNVRKLYSSRKEFDLSVQSDNPGSLTITVSAASTADVEPGKYQYDIIMKTDDNRTVKLIEGLIFVIESITKIETS